MSMQLVSSEDMNFLVEQSSGRLDMILSGMTSLMNDTDNRVALMESQNWFQRMVKTITGKNKLTEREIRQNHDKLNMYMSEAIAELYNRNWFEAMLQGEMDSHLGYEANDHGYKNTSNRRNGYIHKNVKTTYGDVEIDVPRDRKASFEPQSIPKRTRDVRGIEDKVLSMYTKGMSQRDIADTIEDIYG